MPEYNVNITCIKEIKALYNVRKSSKKTCLRGMDEFLKAEGEASRMKAATMIEPEEEEAEEALVRCPQSTVTKRPRSQAAEAGSRSCKRVRQEPEAGAIFEGVSGPKAELESILSLGEETDEEEEYSPSVRQRLICARGVVGVFVQG